MKKNNKTNKTQTITNSIKKERPMKDDTKNQIQEQILSFCNEYDPLQDVLACKNGTTEVYEVEACISVEEFPDGIGVAIDYARKDTNRFYGKTCYSADPEAIAALKRFVDSSPTLGDGIVLRAIVIERRDGPPIRVRFTHTIHQRLRVSGPEIPFVDSPKESENCKGQYEICFQVTGG